MESASELAAARPIGARPAPHHVVQFYESGGFLCDEVARFLAEGLHADQPLLLVATAPHREGIGQRLAHYGFNLSDLCRCGQATIVDAHQLLSTFMFGSRVDAALFKRVIAEELKRSRHGRERSTVRLYAEMVDVLWQRGDSEAALRIEALWNEVAATDAFVLLCGYALEHFRDAAHSRSFAGICRQHGHAIPTESYTRVPDDQGRLTEIALLQQRARSLEAELERRKKLELALRQTLADGERAERQRESLLAREQAAREEAEAASRLKDEFLGVLSHDLRTPLNTILGWAHIINKSGSDDETIRRGLDVIQKNAKLQLSLVDDLLDMSRIISGQMVLRMADVDVNDVLASAVDAVRPALTAKAIDLDLQLDPSVRYMTADRDRLRQVVWQLLSNAIKFTRAQGRIELRLERAGTHAHIVVRDNGRGIAPAFLPHVFERFRQADTGTTRASGGLGIGLALVRHLVEAHGGTVEAASAGDGLGARFTLRLPVHPATNPAAGAADQLAPTRVLIVDDDSDSRDLFGAALRLGGASVQVTASADKALEILSSNTFDVLIADIGMPVRDGYALIEAVRQDAHESIRNICAIAVTAYAGEAYRDRAMSSGYDDYVPKPVDASRLVQLVADLLVRKRNVPAGTRARRAATR
jgi:signal transduction histidine kinase/ActR/RegA family two-component response regulator